MSSRDSYDMPVQAVARCQLWMSTMSQEVHLTHGCHEVLNPVDASLKCMTQDEGNNVLGAHFYDADKLASVYQWNEWETSDKSLSLSNCLSLH